MSIGFGQIVLIIVIVVILFGKFPGLSKDLFNGLANIQTLLKEKQKTSTNEDSKQSESGKYLEGSDKEQKDTHHRN